MLANERRTARRFDGHVGIVSSDEEGLNFSFIENLSRDGAYVETEKVPSIGAEFSFVLSNNLLRARIQSRVVRVRDAFFDGGKSGFGVHFEGLDGASKILRDDLLLYLMNLRYQQVWEAA